MASRISLAEVARHTAREDCWFIIHGKVYDVTKFLEEHPGGEEVLVECAGKDATDEFEDIGHSVAAREQLAEFLVGEAEEAAAPVAPKPKAPEQSKPSDSGWIWKVFQIALPLALLAAAYYLKLHSAEQDKAQEL